MARHRHRSSRRHTTTKKRGSRNFVNKTVGQSVSFAKSTSKKYMPKVKSGLENVGSKVVDTTQKSVPYLQGMTRKLFGMFSGKTRKNRNNRKNRKH
jgi:hypothetical protein